MWNFVYCETGSVLHTYLWLEFFGIKTYMYWAFGMCQALFWAEMDSIE